MKLLSMTARGFRNLPDGERVEFPPGLVFLKGPNEAGKSNLLRALKFALFRIDRRSKSGKGLRLARWESEGDFIIELEFRAADGRHVLRRSSSANRDVLVLPSGEELRGRALKEAVARLTGVPDERAFNATCCVFQGHLPTSSDDVRSLVERSYLGSGDLDVDAVIRDLDVKVDELRRGLAHPAKRPGSILRSREELERARKAGADADVLGEKKRRRKTLADEVGRIEAELADRKKAHEEFGRYLKAKAEDERVQGELARLRKKESQLDSARTEGASIAAGLEEKKKALERKQAEYNLAEATSSRLGELEKDIARLEEMRSKEVTLQKEIESLPCISEEDLRNAASIPRELNGLEAPLRVKAKRLADDVTIELEADGRKLPAGTLEVRAWRALARVPGLVEIEAAVEGVKEEQVRKKRELDRLLSKYGVTSPEELTRIYEKRLHLEAELRELRARREGLLGDSDEAELRKDIDTLRERAGPAEELRRAVEEMEADVTKLERRSAALEEQVRSRREEIPRQRDELATALAKARIEQQGLEGYAAHAPEDLARIERESEEAQASLGEKKRELHSLEGAISESERRAAVGVPDIEGAERKLAALERRARVYSEVRGGLEEAKLRSIGSRRSAMEEAVGNYIRSFSLGNYTRCEFSAGFSLRLWSEEKRGWIAPEDAAEEMSSGLKDQLYLACRLAAIETFFPGPKPPVFLDDPLVHFDPDRASAAIHALKTFAERFQTIVLTCHTYALPEGVGCLALPAET